MEKIFENFTISVMKLHRLVQKIKHFEMSGYGLKAIHVMCIYYLKERKGELTASDLVKLTYEDKAAVSRALKLLSEKGYIDYNPNKYNSIISLTEEGEKVALFIEDKSDKAVKAGSAQMTEGERNMFYASLGSIAENLQKYYEEITRIKE